MISIAAKGLGDRLSARLIAAPASVAIAMPARISVSGLSDRPASHCSNTSATSAPRIASNGKATGCTAATPK